MHMGKYDPKVLTLKAPIKICSRRHLNFVFIFQTIHMKCQDLFSLKKKIKNKNKKKILSSAAVVTGVLRVKRVSYKICYSRHTAAPNCSIYH